MATVTDNDLRELKDLINKINDNVNDIKIDIAILKEGQNGLNKRLDDSQSTINKRLDDSQSTINNSQSTINKRLDDIQSTISKRLDDSQFSINKRIDNLDFIARTVVGGVALALLVGLAKLLYPDLTL